MEFEDPRDADDAVRECDGQEMDQERITEPGKRIKVQISTGGRGGGGGGGGGTRPRQAGRWTLRERRVMRWLQSATSSPASTGGRRARQVVSRLVQAWPWP